MRSDKPHLCFHSRVLSCAIAVCFAISVSIVVMGCSGSLIERQAVFGTITGAEGRSGLVSFIPAGNGPATRVEFNDGRYKFDESNGPVPGKYRVVVQLEKPRPAGTKTVLVKGVPVPVDQAGELGTEYEKRSLEVSVPSDGSMQLNLTLPDQADPDLSSEDDGDSAVSS